MASSKFFPYIIEPIRGYHFGDTICHTYNGHSRYKTSSSVERNSAERVKDGTIYLGAGIILAILIKKIHRVEVNVGCLD